MGAYPTIEQSVLFREWTWMGTFCWLHAANMLTLEIYVTASKEKRPIKPLAGTVLQRPRKWLTLFDVLDLQDTSRHSESGVASLKLFSSTEACTRVYLID